MINIAGAGVRGLSCALYLLNQGYNVTIYQIRQEIGNPTRSPGIIKQLSQDFVAKTVAKKSSYGWAFRREWFEKELAKQVVDSGGKILLKQKSPPDSINCTGGKTTSPGWPLQGTQLELATWSGGITIKKDIPKEFKLDNMSEDRFAFERGDGLVECWIRGNLPRPTQGWLEIMQGEHPFNPEEVSADKAITEGEDLAKNLIHSLREVS